MKKPISIGALTVVMVFTATGVYAERQEGFIKRLLKKVKGEEKTAVTETKKAGPAPTEEAVEKMPELDLDTADPKVIARHLTDLLTHNDEILDFVRDVRAEKDKDGNIFFVHTAEDGTAKRLEELDKATLVKIFNKVSAEANRLNNERLINQLEQIRQAQEAAGIQSQVPATPPVPPETYAPPAAPAAPLAPPAMPTGPPQGGSPPAGPPSQAPSSPTQGRAR